MIERRDRSFRTYVGVDLLQNPFYIFNATQQDNRQRIIASAEERSLLSDADKCMAARTELTNPRNRISAEVAWLPGVAPERVHDIVLLLELSVSNHLGCDNTTPITSVDSLAGVLVRLDYTQKSNVADAVLETLQLSNGDFREVSKFLGFDTLTPIARANLLASRILCLPDYAPDVVVEWILAIVQTFENINPSEVRAILNIEREESGLPGNNGTFRYKVGNSELQVLLSTSYQVRFGEYTFCQGTR